MAQCKWCGNSGILSLLKVSNLGLCSNCHATIAQDIQRRLKIAKESTIIASRSKNTETRLRRADLALLHIQELRKFHVKGIINLAEILEKTVPFLESLKERLLKERGLKPKRKTASPGEAFEETRWGMSQEAVREIYPPADEGPVTVELVADDGSTTTGFAAETEWVDLPAEVSFGFTGDKLDFVSVEILCVDAEDFFSSYETLKKHLTEKFGESSHCEEGEEGNEDQWGAMVAAKELRISVGWRAKGSTVDLRCDDYGESGIRIEAVFGPVKTPR